MSPLCGCWRPKVSTNFNIIRNHACACKFHPRFCPCKIVIKNQCQVQATCDILWWHGIDSCKSRFSPLHNFAYASTWSIYIHFVCVKSFKSICSEWLWHMRPQQVFFSWCIPCGASTSSTWQRLNGLRRWKTHHQAGTFWKMSSLF